MCHALFYCPFKRERLKPPPPYKPNTRIDVSSPNTGEGKKRSDFASKRVGDWYDSFQQLFPGKWVPPAEGGEAAGEKGEPATEPALLCLLCRFTAA